MVTDAPPIADPVEPSPVELPEELKEDFIINKAKHLNKAHAEWFKPYLDAIEDNYKIHQVKPINGMMQGAVNLPTGNSLIETAQSRYMGILGAREKLIEAIQKTVTPTAEDKDTRTSTLEDFINESILNVPDYLEKFDDSVFTFLVEASICYEVFWDTQVTTSMEPQRQTLSPMEAPLVDRVETETTKEFPNLTPLSLRYLAWDPRCKTKINESSWLRKRSMVSANDLLRMEQEGILQGAQEVIEKAPKSNPQSDQQSDPDSKQSMTVEGHALPAINFDDGLFQLDEFWATLAYKSEGKMVQDEFNFWIVGDEKLVKFRVNPLRPKRKPFFSVRLKRKPGPLDITKGLIIDIGNNMARKNRLIANAANTPTFYEPSSGLDGRRTVLQENSLIPVMNVKGIQRFDPPIAALGAVDKHIGFLINQVQTATPSTEQAQGISTEDTPETATENQILDRSSSTRFQYAYGIFAAETFPPIANEMLLLYRQFGQEGQMTIREAGQEGAAKPVTLDDLKGDWEFRSAISQPMANRLGQFQMLKGVVTELAAAYAQNPMIFEDDDGAPMKPTIYPFLKDEMLPLLGITGTNKLFKRVEAHPMAMSMGGPVSMGPAPIMEAPVEAV